MCALDCKSVSKMDSPPHPGNEPILIRICFPDNLTTDLSQAEFDFGMLQYRKFR